MSEHRQNAPDDLQVVYGDDCLDYVDRYLGMIAEDFLFYDPQSIQPLSGGFTVKCWDAINHIMIGQYGVECGITKMQHTQSDPNGNKRIVGLVLNRYEDGGLHVAVLGDHVYVGRPSHYTHSFTCWAKMDYDNEPFTTNYIQAPGYSAYPQVTQRNVYPTSHGTYGGIYRNATDYAENASVDFDEMLEYVPEIGSYSPVYRPLLEMPQNDFLQTDKDHTLHFGRGVSQTVYISPLANQNPVRCISGDMYNALVRLANDLTTVMPGAIVGDTAFSQYSATYGTLIDSTNFVALPFNLILTEHENEALEYINTGRIPSDAWLYPLDWEQLPTWQDTDTDINPEDVPNDNKPGDNDRDITPNPPIVPSFTPAMLSNYNWYWLQVPEYSSFIQWFWNDIGNYSSFTDLIAKVEGLYNDVASAVLMVRYYPVEYSWITNLSQGASRPQGTIKVGMIEKSGNVDLIDQSNPPGIRDIGHVHIPKKYKSFCDLAPYSQLSIYLPYHGFVDLDVDILVGHDLYVKGIYDYLTGTIQYLLYYDNEMLINTFVAKMAVDIPITLQTKNDRDSAVFQNVSSAVGGLIGAGAGMLSGNPIGMAIGVTQGISAINSANASAPLNVKGTVGETGALYSPPQCAIILRRPTIQSSDKGDSLSTWKHNIGQLCGYGYKLSGLNGAGFTTCHTPRINFTKTCPLQTEVDEIYDYLEKGVIL